MLKLRKIIDKINNINLKYMKKTSLIGVVFVAYFFGFITNMLFTSRTDNNKPKEVFLDLLEEENNQLHHEINRLSKTIDASHIDTTHYSYSLVRNADTLVSYFESILSSGFDFKKFSIKEIQKIMKNDFYIDDFVKKVNKVKIDNYSSEEKRLFVCICDNILMNRYLKKYKEWSLMYKEVSCISIAHRDTVELGDDYKTNIYFTITDVSLDEQIKMDNGIKLKDGFYREKTTKRGINKRTGIYEWFHGDRTLWYPIEFSFYVK